MSYITRQAANGFTLVELLIVVIVLSILAAIIVPQFSGTSSDARSSALDSNLASMRSAISLYYHQHGHYPGAVPSAGSCAVGSNTDTATPGAAAFVAHMTQYTTKSGIACSQRDASSGGLIRFGPYLRKIPVNPITEDNTVTAIHTGSLVMAGSGADSDGGWLYDFIVGRIIADQPSYGTH